MIVTFSTQANTSNTKYTLEFGWAEDVSRYLLVPSLAYK
ncbi:hypothetical protein NIES3974_33750 [Calothrix sp. NIES-3974]|nr:hypothetical protein NIES3974_33750 [Calothrix sp. NIES-3974]